MKQEEREKYDAIIIEFCRLADNVAALRKYFQDQQNDITNGKGGFKTQEVIDIIDGFINNDKDSISE